MASSSNPTPSSPTPKQRFLPIWAQWLLGILLLLVLSLIALVAFGSWWVATTAQSFYEEQSPQQALDGLNRQASYQPRLLESYTPFQSLDLLGYKVARFQSKNTETAQFILLSGASPELWTTLSEDFLNETQLKQFKTQLDASTPSSENVPFTLESLQLVDSGVLTPVNGESSLALGTYKQLEAKVYFPEADLSIGYDLFVLDNDRANLDASLVMAYAPKNQLTLNEVTAFYQQFKALN